MPPDSPIFGAPLTGYLPKDGRKDFCLEGVGGGGGVHLGGTIFICNYFGGELRF